MTSSRGETGSARLLPLAILTFFLIDRILSAGFLLPAFCVEDEAWAVDGALHMLRGLTLDPGTHKYPGLIFSLGAAVYAGLYLVDNFLALFHFESGESLIWHLGHYSFGFEREVIAGRMLSAITGLFALVLFFQLVRREYGPGRAAAAVFLTATAPAFLFATGVFKNDPLLIAGVMLVLLASRRLLDRGRSGDYALGGLALGFCLAAKYHLPAAVPLLLAHRLRCPNDGFFRSFARPRWLLIPASGFIGFFALSPMTFLDLGGAVRQAGLEWALQNNLNPLLHRSPEYWWHAPGLFVILAALPLALGIPLWGLAGAGFISTRPWRPTPVSASRTVVWSYPVAFLLFMAASSKLAFPHLFAPAAPFASLLAAGFLEPWLGSPAGVRRAAASLLLGACVLHNLALYHGTAQAEERALVDSATYAETIAVPGEVTLAFVPYRPNPEHRGPVKYLPQFMLSDKTITDFRPDRILIHHAFFNSYGDNPELLEGSPAAAMALDYLKLRAGRAGFRETDRFTAAVPTGSLYTRLLPDLAGVYASLYEREPAWREPEPGSAPSAPTPSR